MEKQIKLLNKEYVKTRLSEMREIKRKEVFFEIEESDRAFSKSLYISIWTQSYGEKKFKNSTLRISDHSITDCPHTQFIIEPESCLTKKKKQQFVRALEKAILKAKTKQLKILLNKISAQGENNE